MDKTEKENIREKKIIQEGNRVKKKKLLELIINREIIR